MPAKYSSSIISHRRSTQQLFQPPNPKQDQSAGQDDVWDVPLDADPSADSTGNLSLHNPNEHVIQEDPLGSNSQRPIDLVDDKNEDERGQATLTKV